MYRLVIGKNISRKDFYFYLLKNDYNNLIYNDYGKPYIKNNPYYFNISNTKDQIYKVGIISNKEIGIDIEQIIYKPHLINKICNDKEIKRIKNADDFTIIWTKKEAYVKYLGIGLSYGLQNVDTNKLNIKTFKYKDNYISIYEEGYKNDNTSK